MFDTSFKVIMQSILFPFPSLWGSPRDPAGVSSWFQHLMSKLEQLITLIGDVNLHLFHLDSWRWKQTSWFIRQPCNLFDIYPQCCSGPRSTAYPEIMRNTVNHPNGNRAYFIWTQRLQIGVCYWGRDEATAHYFTIAQKWFILKFLWLQ